MKRLVIIVTLLYFLPVLFMGCDDGSSPSTGPGDSTDYTTRTALVTYVYDGDTIQVNGSERVRYIGIDTPETGDCYYWEATLRNRELVDDRTVTLEICNADPTDHYGRTLAHIRVDDRLVNAVLLEEGCARTLSIPPCTSRAEMYADLEADARSNNRGMWGQCF